MCDVVYALQLQHIDRLPRFQAQARADFQAWLVSEPERLSPEQSELRQVLGV